MLLWLLLPPPPLLFFTLLKVNGTFVCWYQQPGEFAPLSMTCSVGSCLYEVSELGVITASDVSGSRGKRYAMLAVRCYALLSSALLCSSLVSFSGTFLCFLVCFALFALLCSVSLCFTSLYFALLCFNSQKKLEAAGRSVFLFFFLTTIWLSISHGGGALRVHHLQETTWKSCTLKYSV